jgi:glutathione S-transferase
LCLRRAGLDVAVTVLPMDTPEFEARIGALSPTRRVPVLYIGEECLWDSLAISETVNERFAAGSLWPEDAALRALGRSMAAEMHSGFAALRDDLPMNCRAEGRHVATPASVLRDIARIEALWSDARARSGSSRWLLGSWSIVDAMFAPVVLRFRGYALDLSDDTRAYCNAWLEDDDLREWMRAAQEEPWVIEHEEVGSS